MFVFQQTIALEAQWCGMFQYHWYTASIKQRLLFSLCKLCSMRTYFFLNFLRYLELNDGIMVLYFLSSVWSLWREMRIRRTSLCKILLLHICIGKCLFSKVNPTLLFRLGTVELAVKFVNRHQQAIIYLMCGITYYNIIILIDNQVIDRINCAVYQIISMENLKKNALSLVKI